jgi:hypothetical protein
MIGGTPPGLGTLLLRLIPLGSRRAEVEADLLELFGERATSRGLRYARLRYYGDVLSLWRTRQAPVMHPSVPGSRAAFLREVGQDLSYALRLMRRSPAVVAIVVLGLGLAIGVSTSVFSFLNAVTFRPTGIVDPASTARVMRAYADGSGTSWHYSEYQLLREGAPSVSLDAWFRDDASIAFAPGSETPATTSVMFVTGGYLGNLNNRAARGRLLTPEDDVPGAAPVVVVSHNLWTRTLSSDPGIVGRTIWLNGLGFTVVGVATRGFTGINDSSPTIWAPVASYHLAVGGPAVDRNAALMVNVVARVGPGISRSQAQAELSAVATSILNNRLDSSDQPLTGVTLPLLTDPVDRADAAQNALVVAIVMSVIGLVLLLACSRVTIFGRGSRRYTIYHNDTSAEFFETVGLRAVRGRTYTAAEVADRAPVAVISARLARDFFGGEDPVGQSLARVIEGSSAIVIYVVSDAVTARLREMASAAIYQPMNETLGAKMIVRSAGPPEALIQSIRSALHPLDPRARLVVGLVGEGLQQQISEPRALATIAGALAVIALALAVVGLYGVTAFVVGRRAQEIGLRIALGANCRDVVQFLLSDSLRPVMIGMVGGIVAALLVGRVFAGVLFGVAPADPIAFVSAILVLTAAALAAVIVPTRRASSIDPAAVLRQL